jgi:hypothetical protein
MTGCSSSVITSTRGTVLNPGRCIQVMSIERRDREVIMNRMKYHRRLGPYVIWRVRRCGS